MRRMEIRDADLKDGAQRALELALSECTVAFKEILAENESVIPEGHVIRFRVELVPRE